MVPIMPQKRETHVVQALDVGRDATGNGAALSSHGPKLTDHLHEALRSLATIIKRRKKAEQGHGERRS